MKYQYSLWDLTNIVISLCLLLTTLHTLLPYSQLIILYGPVLHYILFAYHYRYVYYYGLVNTTIILHRDNMKPQILKALMYFVNYA